MMALRVASTSSTLHAGVRASGTRATRLSMTSGCDTPHWSACIPPIEGPITATTWSMPSFSLSSRRCDSTMSRIPNFGNCMRGCALLLLGEVVSPLPMASVATTKYFVVSNALPGPMRKSRR